MAVHPKVAVPTLAGAIAAIIVAVTRGAGDPAAISTDIATIVVFALGYLTPAPVSDAVEYANPPPSSSL